MKEGERKEGKKGRRKERKQAASMFSLTSLLPSGKAVKRQVVPTHPGTTSGPESFLLHLALCYLPTKSPVHTGIIMALTCKLPKLSSFLWFKSENNLKEQFLKR
jgi:hypothetical protein